jgi:YhcH/YjgK/YiaL family protein
MIISNINSPLLSDFERTHPLLPKAIEALRKLAATDPDDAKYVIDGDSIFASVMSYTTAPATEKKFELHRKYIDIQYIISGNEIIGGASENMLTATEGEGTDIEFFSMPERYDEIRLAKGDLAIILPPEPHAPGLADGQPTKVKKIVVKVLY